MPRLRSCAAVARENASCACFDAEYGPDGGNATAPATETMLTTSDGAAGLEPGQERAQAPDAAEVVRPHHVLDRGSPSRKLVRAGNAGVVHEQVNARMALEDARGHALDRLPVGDVAHLVLAADLLGERPQPILASGEQHAVPAAARERRARSLRRCRTTRR